MARPAVHEAEDDVLGFCAVVQRHPAIARNASMPKPAEALAKTGGVSKGDGREWSCQR
jgi:hypothetical protein